METRYMVGLDVGSTTVKAIVAESTSDKVVWQDYQRHETKQPEKVLEFLRRIEAGSRRYCGELTRVHHWLWRRNARRASRREVRTGSDCRFAGSRENASGSLLGD